MKKTIFLLIVTISLLTLTTYGQDRTEKNVAAQVYNKSRGAKDIKSEAPTVDKKAAKSRGDGDDDCFVFVTNRSAYCVKVYIDGYYEATVGAYGRLTVLTGNGYTTFYAQSCGRRFIWRDRGNCEEGYDFILAAP